MVARKHKGVTGLPTRPQNDYYFLLGVTYLGSGSTSNGVPTPLLRLTPDGYEDAITMSVAPGDCRDFAAYLRDLADDLERWVTNRG